MDITIPDRLCRQVTDWYDAQEPEFAKEDHERNYNRIHALEDEAVYLLSHLADTIGRTQDQTAAPTVATGPAWTLCFDWGYPNESVDPVFAVLTAADKETARELAIPLIAAECPGILQGQAAEDAVYGIATFTGDVTGQLTGDAIIIHGLTPGPTSAETGSCLPVPAPQPTRNLLQRIFRKVLPAKR